MEVLAPRGTNDILPSWSAKPQWDITKWQYLERNIKRIFETFGYQEIRTPMFEQTELFVRGIGEATDIVEKEMYTFTDKGGRSLTLRPEGTAPVVRAYLEHKMYGSAGPAKMYYVGPMFRYERPQAGRYRQFYQYGAELIGSQSALADVEMMVMPIELYETLGLEVELQINSIGCPECRPAYQDAIRAHLKERVSKMCPSCQSRYERNPMRILDCKEEECRKLTEDVPAIETYLCPQCAEHFEAVRGYLDQLQISYTINQRLVRGFDYYTKTVFEIVASGLGAQDAIGGGGRYDGLVEECGGKPTPAVGFAAGMDRLLLALEQAGKDFGPGRLVEVYIACLGESARQKAIELAFELRHEGIATDLDYLGRSLKAQMKSANRANARWTLIVGDDELQRGVVTLRDMESGSQEEIALSEIAARLQRMSSSGNEVEDVD